MFISVFPTDIITVIIFAVLERRFWASWLYLLFNWVLRVT